MPEFHLDTSGAVDRPASYTGWGVDRALCWRDMSDFEQGYIEALFFTTLSPAWNSEDWETPACREAQEEGTADGELPGDLGFGDLSGEALLTIKTDCLEFQTTNAALLAQAYDHPDTDYDETMAGRDYWYTRNGHGCGYWDRGLGDIGDALANAARYSEVNPYFANGKVCL